MWDNVTPLNNGWCWKIPTQFCLQLAASIAGFERNWWSDWHEYHLESFYCSVDHRRQLHNRRCMWQKSGGGAQKPESLGVWKVGGLKPSSLIDVYAYVRATLLKECYSDLLLSKYLYHCMSYSTGPRWWIKTSHMKILLLLFSLSSFPCGAGSN